MKSSNLYYQYYDARQRQKNYKKETDLVFSQARRQGISHPKKILEIGCGTGNHTIQIAKRVPRTTAIDIDQKVIAVARRKIANASLRSVNLLKTPVEKLKERNFDLALALFNIVNFIPDEPRLKSFMRGVYDRLTPKGVFIFDCWNGVAVILDPPRQKKIIIKEGQKRIKCVLTPKTDLLNQKVVLNHNIEINENKKLRKGTFSFYHTLWTPWQIKLIVQNAGFKTVRSFPFMEPNKTITERDWRIMFVCKK